MLEFVCVIGHSGCGKSTILNILAGLDTPSEGVGVVAGKAIDGPTGQSYFRAMR